jgi:DNA-binding transcriptional MerR regulator
LRYSAQLFSPVFPFLRCPNAVSDFPEIPAKRYFTIGEVGELCRVKPHVLRYWEQEFAQLKPIKRRGNRRYYQHHEVSMVRRIRELLYEHGYTISGARNQLEAAEDASTWTVAPEGGRLVAISNAQTAMPPAHTQPDNSPELIPQEAGAWDSLQTLRRELYAIRQLLVA